MTDTTAEGIDLIAAEPDGGLIILRPRLRLQIEEMRRLSDQMARVSKEIRASGTNVSFVLIPNDFDVIVVGADEIKRGATLEPVEGA